MENEIQNAINTNNYTTLSTLFTTKWPTLGQGEQRTLALHFIQSALSSPTFFPPAFHSSQIISIIHTTLRNLPPVVDQGIDNTLRQLLFTHLVEQKQDYHSAAMVLAELRIESEDESSVYYFSPEKQINIHVQIAECFLMVNDTEKAEIFVNKAGVAVDQFENKNMSSSSSSSSTTVLDPSLILRYKSTFARILDSNRKFLQAAIRYYDLSKSSDDLVEYNDLIDMLGRAVTCAILAKRGRVNVQSQRILGLLYKDERLSQLDSIDQYHAHSSILEQMYKNQIIRLDDSNTNHVVSDFENSLSPHQQSKQSDGLSIFQRSLLEHNMMATSRVYTCIHISSLGQLLNVNPDLVESIAAEMIMNKSLSATIDQVEGLLVFEEDSLVEHEWDDTIGNFCQQLNRLTDAISF